MGTMNETVHCEPTPSTVSSGRRRRPRRGTARAARGRRRRRLAWAASTILAGVAMMVVLPLAGLAPTAAAHTGLLSTNPAADARLTTPPQQLRLTFSDEVTPQFADVALSVDGGSSHALDSEVTGAVVTAKASSTAGGAGSAVWKVAYRVVSSDGHPISGNFTFTVVSSSPTPTARPSAMDPTPRTASASPTPTTSRPPADAPVQDIHKKRKYGWIVFGGVALLMAAPAAGALYGVGKPQTDQWPPGEPPQEGPSEDPPVPEQEPVGDPEHPQPAEDPTDGHPEAEPPDTTGPAPR